MTIVHKFLEEHNCEKVKGIRKPDLKDEFLNCLASKESKRKSKQMSE